MILQGRVERLIDRVDFFQARLFGKQVRHIIPVSLVKLPDGALPCRRTFGSLHDTVIDIPKTRRFLQQFRIVVTVCALQGFHRLAVLVCSIRQRHEVLDKIEDIRTIKGKNRNACHQCSLPREQRAGNLPPHGNRAQTLGSQCRVFPPDIGNGISQYREVVRDGKEPRIRTDGKSGQFPGNLLDGHVQSIKPRSRIAKLADIVSRVIGCLGNLSQ